MRLSGSLVRNLCARRGRRLGEVLRKAGVSRTAYYSLARKDHVLPGSVLRLARELGVRPGDVLEDEAERQAAMRRLAAESREIARSVKGDSENVRHTRILLGLEPAERLRRALLRGGRI